MKSSKTFLLVLLVCALAAGCGGGGGSSSSGTTESGGGGNSPPSGTNVLAVTVNGALCSNNAFPNKACVAVTVCEPGTSTCQTVDDILLDTASYGLRIFKQALALSLPQTTIGSSSLAECIQFGDGSSVWGPVQTASVILAGEGAVQIPIHVIDSAFGTLPAPCENAEESPATAGFNGILGIGLFAEDCGHLCTAIPNNGIYYACGGSGGCTGTVVPLSGQVQNPVPSLPQDNNGVVVQFPEVPASGLTSLSGSVFLGIGTRSNNTPSGVTTYPADQAGNFLTTFNGVSMSSFLDTGSNGLFFPSQGILPDCATDPGWFCPSSLTTLSATNRGASGTPSNPVQFQIGNFLSLAGSGNRVFSDIGGDRTGQFIWGLPFHFGRSVYLGFEDRPSSLGNGPYWAY